MVHRLPGPSGGAGYATSGAPCGGIVRFTINPEKIREVIGPKGLLDLLMTAPDLAPLRRDMGLNRQSVVLLISTEGDTDPVHYQKVMTHD